MRLGRTGHDDGAAAERLRAPGLPEVETPAVRHVLDPPPQAETPELFASVGPE